MNEVNEVMFTGRFDTDRGLQCRENRFGPAWATSVDVSSGYIYEHAVWMPWYDLFNI
jgi:hypothetical protein